MRLAYLLSRYPAVSHTFFLHEVQGLRARGLAIETFSINPPDRPVSELPEEERGEAGATTYLQNGSRLRAALELPGILLRFPRTAGRGLRAVLALRGLTLQKRLFWLFYLAEALLLGHAMRRRGLGHLHVHFGGAVASVGMLTAAAWRVPYSLTIHGPEELLNVEAYQLRAKVERAAFVICISDFCRSQLCLLLPPAQWGKLHVVRLGIDPALLSPASRRPLEEERGSRPLELVTTGRLVAAKGHAVLLEALSLLRDRGVTIAATLIGDGPERAALEREAGTRGLAIRFTGALSHAQTLSHLRRADLFALPSFAEGVPVAIMEAMALGLPSVSTSIAGIPELIESGVDGLLVPPGNASALADALERLARSPSLTRTLGCAGRRKIVASYNLPRNHVALAARFAAETGGGAR